MIAERVKGFKRNPHLAKKFCELGYTKGVEVGVRVGKFSEVLCRNNPGLHLTGVDDYDTVEIRGKRLGERRQNGYYKEALERMKSYGSYTIIRKPSMEAVIGFPLGELDFVYIDGGHEFDFVMCDMIEWAKRVRKGGTISGHDYFRFKNADVIDAVNTYCDVRRIRSLYITDEKEPSWWFEKTW